MNPDSERADLAEPVVVMVLCRPLYSAVSNGGLVCLIA